jgi:hypothetical protein
MMDERSSDSVTDENSGPDLKGPKNDHMVYRYQRRTLTGTGRQKTVPGSTEKNPRSVVASLATSAKNMAGFFDISSYRLV